MEELHPFLCYYEEPSCLSNLQSTVEELKEKLLLKSFEFESMKNAAAQQTQLTKKHMEYITKQNEYILNQDDQMKKLINQVKLLADERDESNRQLNKLLITIPTKSGSSITQSNAQASLSDFSSSSRNPRVVDPYNAAVGKLLEGKVLPEKGNLLQTVINAGPLLNTLMAASPLPRWTNPPSFHIPPPPPPPPIPTMITAQQSIYLSSASQASAPNMNGGYGSFINNQNPTAKRKRL